MFLKNFIGTPPRLAKSFECIHHLDDLQLLLLWVLLLHGMGHTGVEMMLHHDLLHSLER